ncbi:MAG: N-acetylneuraminate synthase family protein [bacterium]|nr:N-acetylneuraminate synthase family protein [bacterium]
MKIYLIAAADISVGGDLAAARGLIGSAKAAGADAVKFSSFRAETLAHGLFAADQHSFLRNCELSREVLFELTAACHEADIDFTASAADFDAVDLLCELGSQTIRISSGDATNLPLIAYAAQHNVPLFISTGMCSLGEAADAYYCAIEEGAPRVVLLHATSAYPTPVEEVNLQAISTLAGELFCEVGYSDHAAGLDCCIGAAALGAKVIEKHLRLEGTADNDRSASACDAAQFTELTVRLRVMEQAVGDGEKRLMPSEVQNAEHVRRSVFYSRDMAAGERINWGDLAFLRPVIGLSPAEAYRFVGRTLGVDMQAGELASEQDIAVVELKEKAVKEE